MMTPAQYFSIITLMRQQAGSLFSLMIVPRSYYTHTRYGTAPKFTASAAAAPFSFKR